MDILLSSLETAERVARSVVAKASERFRSNLAEVPLISSRLAPVNDFTREI
jgi:hypothetical protein